jgi:hypothetical protein
MNLFVHCKTSEAINNLFFYFASALLTKIEMALIGCFTNFMKKIKL